MQGLVPPATGLSAPPGNRVFVRVPHGCSGQGLSQRGFSYPRLQSSARGRCRRGITTTGSSLHAVATLAQASNGLKRADLVIRTGAMDRDPGRSRAGSPQLDTKGTKCGKRLSPKLHVNSTSSFYPLHATTPTHGAQCPLVALVHDARTSSQLAHCC